MMQPLYCYFHNEVHEFEEGELERLVQTLIVAEHDAGQAPEDGRQPDTLDCLRDHWLRLSWELEGYAEHVEQAILCRRDKVGPRPGDEDLCRKCEEPIHWQAGSWWHKDPVQFLSCEQPEPDLERTP